MKSTILFLVFSSIFTLNAQTTYVPDNNFEQALIDLGYDDVFDDYVLTSNISGLASLSIQNLSISDLTGLQDFASLTRFYVDGNNISSMPFHFNVNLITLFCQNNNLTELDLSAHTNLGSLYCSDNNISTLDLSNNLALEDLYVSRNNLISLDISHLEMLMFFGSLNPLMQTIDVRNGNNTNISQFSTSLSPNLAFIYVDDCNYSTTNWTDIDPSTIFVEMEGQTECERLDVGDFTAELELSFFPNPVKDVLNLQIGRTIEIDKIDLLGILGEKIKSYPTNMDALDFSEIPSGVYFLRIKTNFGVLNKKVLKE